MQSAIPVMMALPLLVFGGAAVLRPPPPPAAPIPVPIERITARRMDADTFRLRWPADLPPATVIRTVQVTPVPAEPAVVAPPPARVVKRASLHVDICARHGLRRVEYLKRGYRHWRCRK